MVAKSILKKMFYNNPAIFSRVYCFVKHNSINVKGDNKIILERAFLNRCKIIVRGRGNTIEIAPGAQLNNTVIRVSGDGNVLQIGKNTSFVDAGFYLEDDDNCIRIGDNSTTSGVCHFSCAEGTTLIVGDDCMFSANIEIRTSDAHSIFDPNGIRTNYSENISIDNHCWIGNTVIILKGTTISANSIIGAGSVVKGVFSEKGSIIAGNPAKAIKTGYTWSRERIN